VSTSWYFLQTRHSSSRGPQHPPPSSHLDEHVTFSALSRHTYIQRRHQLPQERVEMWRQLLELLLAEWMVDKLCHLRNKYLLFLNHVFTIIVTRDVFVIPLIKLLPPLLLHLVLFLKLTIVTLFYFICIQLKLIVYISHYYSYSPHISFHILVCAVSFYFNGANFNVMFICNRFIVSDELYQCCL